MTWKESRGPQLDPRAKTSPVPCPHQPSLSPPRWGRSGPEPSPLLPSPLRHPSSLPPAAVQAGRQAGSPPAHPAAALRSRVLTSGLASRGSQRWGSMAGAAPGTGAGLNLAPRHWQRLAPPRLRPDPGLHHRAARERGGRGGRRNQPSGAPSHTSAPLRSGGPNRRTRRWTRSP